MTTLNTHPADSHKARSHKTKPHHAKRVAALPCVAVIRVCAMKWRRLHGLKLEEET